MSSSDFSDIEPNGAHADALDLQDTVTRDYLSANDPDDRYAYLLKTSSNLHSYRPEKTQRMAFSDAESYSPNFGEKYRETLNYSESGKSSRLANIHAYSGAAQVPEEIKEIYKELADINLKLKRELKILHDREQHLRAREAALDSTIQQEVHIRTDRQIQQDDIVQKQFEEVKKSQCQLEEALRDKAQENRRLRENFETLKSANDSLRKELETLQQQHSKLEKQNGSLQARFVNLQRKREYEERKTQIPATVTQVPTQKPAPRHRAKSSSSPDLVYYLMEWVTHTCLQVPDHKDEGSLQDRCVKILSSAVEVLQESAKKPDSVYTTERLLICLNFIYWTLYHLQNQQKSAMTSSLRRLGEELFQGRTMTANTSMESNDLDLGTLTSTKVKENMFLKSTNSQIRLLSCLIVLQTLTQVDKLAYTFEVLRNDMKESSGRDLFLRYNATSVVLFHLKASNKVLCAAAMDVYLQLSMEGPQLAPFLQSCCNQTWFHSAALLWTLPSLQAKLMEKLSILLQKLSKIKGVKKLFDTTGILASCNDLIRGAAKDNPFLLLNIKSILFNLNVTS